MWSEAGGALARMKPTKDIAGLRVWQAVGDGDLGEVRRGLDGGVPVNWKNEDEV